MHYVEKAGCAMMRPLSSRLAIQMARQQTAALLSLVHIAQGRSDGRIQGGLEQHQVPFVHRNQVLGRQYFSSYTCCMASHPKGRRIKSVVVNNKKVLASYRKHKVEIKWNLASKILTSQRR